MNIVLFGPPGVGKGTQSALLVERLNMLQISTGDLLRKAIAAGSELGKQAKGFMDAGALVPDQLVINLVAQEIKSAGGRSVILDGFPRNVQQAGALSEMVQGLGQKIDRAIFLVIDEALLFKRLTGRRVCEKCGATFNLETQPPKKADQCDRCGSALVQRKDDKAEVIGSRLKAYKDSTLPLHEYFQKKGILAEVDADGPVEEVFSRLRKFV